MEGSVVKHGVKLATGINVNIFGILVLEEEASYRRKPQLSGEEEQYLCDILSLERQNPKQKLLCEVANDLYGRKFRDLQPRPCVNSATGEVVLVEKATLYLQKQMERSHHSVSQMAFNIGKLTGENSSPSAS